MDFYYEENSELLIMNWFKFTFGVHTFPILQFWSLKYFFYTIGFHSFIF